jgi:hypothetical protein
VGPAEPVVQAAEAEAALAAHPVWSAAAAVLAEAAAQVALELVGLPVALVGPSR